MGALNDPEDAGSAGAPAMPWTASHATSSQRRRRSLRSSFGEACESSPSSLKITRCGTPSPRTLWNVSPCLGSHCIRARRAVRRGYSYQRATRGLSPILADYA